VQGEVNGAMSNSIVSFEAAREARLGGSEPPVSPANLDTVAAPSAFDYAPERPASHSPLKPPASPAGFSEPAASEGPRLPEYRPPA
jgi:hypothetical protein